MVSCWFNSQALHHLNPLVAPTDQRWPQRLEWNLVKGPGRVWRPQGAEAYPASAPLSACRSPPGKPPSLGKSSQSHPPGAETPARAKEAQRWSQRGKDPTPYTPTLRQGSPTPAWDMGMGWGWGHPLLSRAPGSETWSSPEPQRLVVTRGRSD